MTSVVRFVTRYVPDLYSQGKTSKPRVRIEVVASGRLKGKKYFVADEDSLDALHPVSLNSQKLDAVPQGIANKFLEIDPDSEKELLDFQNEYGEIGSLLNEEGIEVGLFEERKGKLSREFCGWVAEEKEACKESADIGNYLQESGISNIHPHSVREVRAVVKRLQYLMEKATKLSAALEKGEDVVALSTTGPEEGPADPEMISCSEYYSDLTNLVIGRDYPAFELQRRESQNDDKVDTPLVHALLIDKANEIRSNDPYRVCELCGRLFKHKFDKGKKGGRTRDDARFCSEDCRKLQKSRNQNARRRERRKKEGLSDGER